MKRSVAFLLLLASACLMAGCNREQTHITVSAAELYGKWQKSATQEYWRYNADSTGVTWDESEDVSEEESNLTFRWTINGDVLTHVFTGAMDNQAVPKVYTVTAISGGSMSWEDDYGMSYTLVKCES